MKVTFTRYGKPNKPGYYLAKYPSGKIEAVEIFLSGDSLYNRCGSTHYSRWDCAWSDAIEGLDKADCTY